MVSPLHWKQEEVEKDGRSILKTEEKVTTSTLKEIKYIPYTLSWIINPGKRTKWRKIT